LLSARDGIGDKLAGKTARHGVVILVSQPSVAVRWMLDSAQDGDTCRSG